MAKVQKRSVEVDWLRRLLREMTRRNRHLGEGDNYLIAIREVRDELRRRLRKREGG